MSLSGVKDLSLILTAPFERLAVRSYVAKFDEITISEGQVPTELKETIVMEDPLNTTPINLRGISLFEKTYVVSGLFTSDTDVPKLLVPFLPFL